MTSALQPVVILFLQTYLVSKSPDDLTHFVAPGTTLHPLRGLLEWKELSDRHAFGSDPTIVIATADVIDPTDGGGNSTDLCPDHGSGRREMVCPLF